jgi:WD40 repeat protein
MKIAAAEHGGSIISGGERRGVISIWADRTVSSTPKEFDAHELKITGLAFLNRNEAFVSTSEDGAIALWKADGTPISRASAHPNKVRQLLRHPTDGEILTIGDDRMLRVWGQDLKSMGSISLPAAASIFNLSGDNSRLVVVLENGKALTVPSSIEQLHAALSAQP